MADAANIEGDLYDTDERKNNLTSDNTCTNKTTQHLIRNITAFFTTLVIVAIFMQLSLHHNAMNSQRLTTSENVQANQTHRTQKSEKDLLFKPHRRRNKVLVDSMWTMEPDIPNSKLTNVLNKKNLMEYYLSDDLNDVIDSNDVDSIAMSTPAGSDIATVEITTSSDTTPASTDKPTTPITTSSDTTPASTDKPTTPLTTSSDTTPMYTQSPTPPITTASETTPMVTLPGGDPIITTEADPNVEDPNETMKLVRIRRGNAPVSPTTEDPNQTSRRPMDCPNTATAYIGPYGACQCGRGRFGFECTGYLNPSERGRQLTSSVTYSTEAVGEFTNADRAELQKELEKQFVDLDGFVRIFIVQPVYNSTTNSTTIDYIVFFDKTARPQDIHGSAGITTRVVNQTLPITINGINVVFRENETLLVRETVGGVISTVPIGAVTTRDVCYIYNELDVCGTLSNRGICVDNDGVPECTCQIQYLGEFCDEEIQFAEDDENEAVLVILLPVLGGLAGAVLVCSCCFFICLRRTNKGEPEESESEISSEFPRTTLILPRYHPISNWKEFVPGPEPEEVHYYQPEVEVQPIIIERPVIVERVVERPVVYERQYVERPVEYERQYVERPVVYEHQHVERPVVYEHQHVERPVVYEHQHVERPVVYEHQHVERPVVYEYQHIENESSTDTSSDDLQRTV